jgi:hypothetical protein
MMSLSEAALEKEAVWTGTSTQLRHPDCAHEISGDAIPSVGLP